LIDCTNLVAREGKMDDARRRWLKHAALLGTAAALGCQREQPRSETTSVVTTAPPPAKARCDDVSGLTADEINRRKELKYVDRSSNPQQTCGNCNHVQPVPGSNDPCKRCSVVPGPVHIDGWCTAWIARVGGGS
jgi:hypothetical protein